ncbi:MAG: fdxA [Actinotalea sp.]|nr:fdxA [Actinotalea sp.]
MPFTIGAPCIEVMDKSCMEECPVDCIYEGDRKLYINPAECIDCGACEPVCPAEAITTVKEARGDQALFAASDARFFTQPLPGRAVPLGNPGGASKLGRVGADTELVAGWAP